MLRVSKLKEEHRVLPTFTSDDIARFVKWKPSTMMQKRLQTLVLTLIDTGIRIGEALSLRWDDVDFDNLLLTVQGKGGKDRRVPFSFELRRILWRHQQRAPSPLVFSTCYGTRLDRRDVLRDVKRMCGRLGVKVPARTLHAFRHSFALNGIRAGGCVPSATLLGHTTLQMTMKYVNLNVQDLQANHEKVSMLGAALRR